MDSFYVHQSVFLESVDTSWRLEACGHINSVAYPLLTLLNMLEIEPYRKVLNHYFLIVLFVCLLVLHL
jgi:DNA repair protein RAD5